jgi:hypothetical protein
VSSNIWWGTMKKTHLMISNILSEEYNKVTCISLKISVKFWNIFCTEWEFRLDQ